MATGNHHNPRKNKRPNILDLANAAEPFWNGLAYYLMPVTCAQFQKKVAAFFFAATVPHIGGKL
jgi:hypothetical protein